MESLIFGLNRVDWVSESLVSAFSTVSLTKSIRYGGKLKGNWANMGEDANNVA